MKLAPLPEVMDRMKPDFPDLSENDLALTAAMLLVSADWEDRGLLPASFVDMRADVESLTAQHGYPKQEGS